MSRAFVLRRTATDCLMLALIAACAPVASTPTTTPTPALIESSHSSLSQTPSPTTASPTVVSSPQALRTPVPEAATVQVTALGNLHIRRGPDLAFNPVAVLMKGAVVTATGRDVLSNWLRISLPENGSRQGWISIMSEFSEVQGDVSALPEIDPQDWPELASLRNCTYHELLIEPLGLTLPPVYEFPNNDLRINPGVYSIRDVDADGYPEVLQVDLLEGVTIDILVDGFGEKKKCPPP